jgi:hypothetical protein
LASFAGTIAILPPMPLESNSYGVLLEVSNGQVAEWSGICASDGTRARALISVLEPPGASPNPAVVEMDWSGFEPEASGLQNRRSSELIYQPAGVRRG